MAQTSQGLPADDPTKVDMTPEAVAADPPHKIKARWADQPKYVPGYEPGTSRQIFTGWSPDEPSMRNMQSAPQGETEEVVTQTDKNSQSEYRDRDLTDVEPENVPAAKKAAASKSAKETQADAENAAEERAEADAKANHPATTTHGKEAV